MSNSNIVAGAVAAAAAAVVAGGSVSAAAASAPPSVCTLFLAESTIPNAGLGVFTTMPYKKGDLLHNAPQDILIPVSGHGEDDIGMLVDYYWETTNSKHHRLTFPEGPFASDFIPGYGACPNSDAALENVEHITRNAHSDRPSRPYVGVDAYTPYHHVQINAVKDIPGDGAEIFIDYGSSYFETREGIYKEVPLYDDYKEAERIIKLFVQEQKQKQQREDEELIQHLWEVVVNATASIRIQKALPSHVKNLITTEDSNFEDGETETKFSLLDPYRDVEVLKQTGFCLNMVEIKKSTIVEAGRGTFAKTFIEQGTVILPVPVMQMKLTKLEQLKPPSGLLDGSPIPSINLIINYCFGDATKSSIILCPYVAPALLVNHLSQKPNAIIRRTVNSDQPPYYSKPDLYDLPIRFMKNTPLGVMFELVALRPIEEGEEILIDYGPEWEQAWNTYKEGWKGLIDDSPASAESVDTLLDCVIDYGTDLPHHESLIPSCIADNAHRWLGEVPGKPVKTMNGGEGEDTVTNTACYYYLPRSKQKSQQQRPNTNDDKASPAMVLPWGFDSFYEDGTSTLGGLFPCRILAKQKTNQNSNTCSSSNNPQQSSDEDDSTSTCNNDNYYTAWIAVDVFDDRNRATIRHPQMVLVKNIPQSHIRYVTHEWLNLPSIDRRLQKKKKDSENDNKPPSPQPKPFRHLIGLPDGVFPTAWMDRLSKENEKN